MDGGGERVKFAEQVLHPLSYAVRRNASPQQQQRPGQNHQQQRFTGSIGGVLGGSTGNNNSNHFFPVGGPHRRSDGAVSHVTAKSALQGRLQELVVFVLYEAGEPEYHTMTLRQLYTYVMKAITCRPMGHFVSGGSDRDIKSPSLRAVRQTSVDYPCPPPLSLNQSDGHLTGPRNNGQQAPASGSAPVPGEQLQRQRTVSFRADVDVTPGGAEGDGGGATQPPVPTAATTDQTDGRSSAIGDDPAHPPPRPPPAQEQQQPQQPPPPTSVPYRERLGGYLHPRDMRRLVTPFSATNQPELIVRRHVMLLNFDPLRAIVLRDRLLVLVPDGADSILIKLERRLTGGVAELENEVFGERTSGDATTVSNTTSVVGGGSTRQEEETLPRNGGDVDGPSSSPISEEDDGGGGGGATTKEEVVEKSTFVGTFVPFLRRGSTDNLQASGGDGGGSGGGGDGEVSGVVSGVPDSVEFPSPISGRDFELVPGEIDHEVANNEWDDIDKRNFIEDMPFELLAVDVVLETVVQMLLDDAHQLTSRVCGTMSILRGEHRARHPSQNIQEDLRIFKDQVKEMEARVRGFERAITQVLNEDEDMALMNLGRLLTHPERFIMPVSPDILNEESDEPELILEAYLQQALSAMNELRLLDGQIDTTEELVSMKLDTVRNRLLLINTLVSLVTLCITAASLIGSIFGMNLINHLEEDEVAFYKVVAGTIIGTVLLFVALSLGFWRASSWW